MRILIAVPTFRYIETECIQSLWDLKKPDCEIKLYTQSSYAIDVARNKIAMAAENYDYIFWVDADILLPENALVNLLEHDKDIVSGVYVYKDLVNDSAVLKRFNGNDKYGDVKVKELLDEPSPSEIDACGFGCVLMKTEILKKIEYPYFVYTADMGEDVYFCRKLQNAGVKIYADNRVLCGHKGTVNYNIRGK
jgi:GT2 family glycosyltransferase